MCACGSDGEFALALLDQVQQFGAMMVRHLWAVVGRAGGEAVEQYAPQRGAAFKIQRRVGDGELGLGDGHHRQHVGRPMDDLATVVGQRLNQCRRRVMDVVHRTLPAGDVLQQLHGALSKCDRLLRVDRLAAVACHRLFDGRLKLLGVTRVQSHDQPEIFLAELGVERVDLARRDQRQNRRQRHFVVDRCLAVQVDHIACRAVGDDQVDAGDDVDLVDHVFHGQAADADHAGVLDQRQQAVARVVIGGDDHGELLVRLPQRLGEHGHDAL